MDLALLQSWLGWSLIVNAALLLISSAVLLIGPKLVLNIHQRISGIPAQQLKLEYLRFLGNYKILVIVFNLVPWLALLLVS
ncbi:DUF6868 family protein [Agaribacterium haliotis]|uniref:DUF6868 family protein n=1 Tax=Agaribacterium haliotis TaxID=2013869 RepID=UPI000BB5321D|nr:hypothetical protein [Agaribacterium haliotis]